jgi:hypothetical protein
MIENALAFVKEHKRLVTIVVGLIAVLLLSWYILTKGEAWYGNRQIDKARANVAIATQDLQKAQANVNQDNVDVAVKLENVKLATNQYVEAVNATDAAKAETNRALTNLSNAVNNNHPVGITADDLQKRLDELDQ